MKSFYRFIVSRNVDSSLHLKCGKWLTLYLKRTGEQTAVTLSILNLIRMNEFLFGDEEISLTE